MGTLGNISVMWGNMNEILNDAAWKKTLDLVKTKYGKSLSYRSIKICKEDKVAAYSQGDDFIIPLRLKNYDLGDVIVARGSLLDSQQKTEVVDLVKFLVEPKIYNIHLKQTEENSAVRSSATHDSVRKIFKLELHKSEIKDERKTLSQMIHLKSEEKNVRQKVASKIHEMTERNLFVFLDDIATSLTNVEEIRTLGDTTIYIESLEDLSAAMIGLLQQYLSNNYDDGPLFLIGSNLALSEIQNKDWSVSFKNDLMGFFFDIDRVPLAQQASEEILELLFFQLEAFSV